jgi:hypothetical protein
MPSFTMSEDAYWQVPERFRPLVDAQPADGPRARMSFFFLGDPDSESTPTALVLDMEPGFVISRHAHESERFEVVTRGSLDIGDRVLHPGDVTTAGHGEFYGPKIAGPEGCTTVEFFDRPSGAYVQVRETLEGATVRTDLLAGDVIPAGIAGMEDVPDRVAKVLAARDTGAGGP